MDTRIRQITTPAGDPAWHITGYETVKTLLADPRLGRSHPEPEKASRYTDSVIFGRATGGTPEAEREQNQQMRKLLSRSFSARRLTQLKPRVQALVDGLLDETEHAGSPADLHERLSFPLPVLVICELLGVPYEDREQFRHWSDDAADMTSEATSLAGIGKLQAYMRSLLDRKRGEPAEDVLSDLLGAQAMAPDAFTDDHVVSLAAGLLFAGHETTVSAIDRGIVLFLTHPDQLAALRGEPALVSSAVEEILRLNRPRRQAGERTGGIPRYASADLDVAGTTVSAGDLVLLDTSDANHDDAVFTEPEDFDIRRQNNPHVTFGHGPHFCIGASLARIELQSVFGTLFDRLPGLRLTVPAEELPRRTHLLTGGLSAMPVAW
ncbi:cytochrome P450 family protein [Flindersiella endophytica]